MPDELRWNLADGQSGNVLGAPEPTVVPPRRIKPGQGLAYVLYILALCVAAWVGYALGRWTDTTSPSLDGIDNQLAIESLAWREGDAALFETTLHPEAAADWRRVMVDRFLADAPRTVTLRSVAKEAVSPRLARVTVAVTDGANETLEEWTYEVIGSTWYRRGPAADPPVQ